MASKLSGIEFDKIPATMDEQVSMIKQYDVSYRTTHTSLTFLNKQDDRVINVPYESILNKYRDAMSDCVVAVRLGETEQRQYRFQPKKLSEDLYGTTELWADLMKLNGCISIVDFKPIVLFCYDPSRLKQFVNEVMILEPDIDV